MSANTKAFIEFGPAQIHQNTEKEETVYSGFPMSGRISQSDSSGQGITIMTTQPTLVLAPAPGSVVHIKTSIPSDWGHHVVLKHDDGSYSLYAHLEEAAKFEDGMELVRGEILGKVSGQLIWRYARDSLFQNLVGPLNYVTDSITAAPYGKKPPAATPDVSADWIHHKMMPEPGGEGWMPGVTYIPTHAYGSPEFRPGSMKAIAVMSHVMQGFQEDLINLAIQRPPREFSSSHFSINQEGRIIQHVSIFDQAWDAPFQNTLIPNYSHYGNKTRHPRHPNELFVQIQHEGFSVDPKIIGVRIPSEYIYSSTHQWPEAMIEASIQVHTWAIKQLELEPSKDTIIGYSGINKDAPNDPGETWPQEMIIAGVRTGETSLPAPPKTDYVSDSPEKDDLLNIRPDVNAFARLISANRVTPPLSIGLFGKWGSGKTFFMKQLFKEVEDIKKQVGALCKLHPNLPLSEIAYFENVVQIEFNAWHYVDANLWASLVAHIFNKLSRSTDKKQSDKKSTQEVALTDLKVAKEARAVAVARQKEAQETRDEANNVREIQLADFEIRKDEYAALVAQDVWEIFKHKITDISSYKDPLKKLKISTHDIEQAYHQINELRSVTGRIQAIWMQMLTTKIAWDRKSPMLWAGMVVLIGMGMTLVLVNINKVEIGVLIGIIGQVAGLVIGIAKWIGNSAESVTNALEPLTHEGGFLESIENELKAAKKERAEAIAKLEKELERYEIDWTEATKNLSQAEENLRAANAELKESQTGQYITRFIQERAGSDDYKKHLGIISMIREDFENLSEKITEFNNFLLSGTNQSGVAHDKQRKLENLGVNRIILYIDDLDRCPPERVIEVLQAVHLLLAFPLFVVVVGVDSRWVSQSLRSKYGRLLEGGGETIIENRYEGSSATPHDYLEKIFQIPFWIQAIDEPERKDMIDGLTKESRDRFSGKNNENNGGTKPPIPPNPNGKEQIVLPIRIVNKFREVATNLNPDNLSINPDEHEFMQELAPILGSSPRALKRFINVYLLIKSGLSESEHHEFIKANRIGPSYKSTLFLLSVVTGLSALSQIFFNHLFRMNQKTPKINFQTFLTHFYKIDPENETADLERSILKDWMKKNGESLNYLSVSTVAQEAQHITRYSFHIGNA